MKKFLCTITLIVLLTSCIDRETIETSLRYTKSFMPYVGKTTKDSDITKSYLQKFSVYGGYEEVLSNEKVIFNFDEDILDKEIEVSEVKLSNVYSKGNLTACFNNETSILQQQLPSERDPLADGKLCILAIGNSFSQDAVEQYLYELFDAAGIEAVIGNLYIGGCRLDTHWANAQSENGAYKYRKVVNGVKNQNNNVSLPQGLADEDWDIITVQQASGSSGQYETYIPNLGNLIDWISQRSDADIWFHQTWAYAKNSAHTEFSKYNNDQFSMYKAIMECVQKAMAENPQLKGVIPTGTAIQNARTSFLGDSFNRDGYHLETTYSRYTAACTWFEALSGINVVGNSYAPSTVNAVQKEIAQNASHLAVLHPYEITEMIGFAKPDVSDPLTSSRLINFNGNKSDNSWNFIGEIDATEVPLTDAVGNDTYVTLTIEKLFISSFNSEDSETKEDDIIASGRKYFRFMYHS